MTKGTFFHKMRFKPFKHDCDKCIFVGWNTNNSNRIENIYFCLNDTENARSEGSIGTIIWRYSDEPSDYRSNEVFTENKPYEISMGEQMGTLCRDAIEKRKKRWIGEPRD